MRFFRIHRSAIVNATYVREVMSRGDGRCNVYLQGGEALPIGPRTPRDPAPAPRRARGKKAAAKAAAKW